MRNEQSRKPWKPRLTRLIGFVQVQGFQAIRPKTLALPLERFAFQWKYALQQCLNSIKTAPFGRFYGIARLPPGE